MIRISRNFFALGFSVERCTIGAGDGSRYWPAWHIKVFLGPAIVMFTLRTGRKRKYEF